MVHLLGNGPSIRCFETTLFHKQPEDGIRIGCNWGHPHLSCEFLACDKLFIWNLCEKQIRFTTPIVCKRHQLEEIKAISQYPQHLLKLKFKLAPLSVLALAKDGFSSGHLAAACSCVWFKPKTMHLWGIDRLWTNNTTSIYDSPLSHKAIYHHLWKGYWIEIFTTYSKTQFVIHAPTPIENLPKNVVTEML